MPRIFTVILFIFCINCLSAQQKEVVRSIFWKGDTLPHVWLEEVSVRQKNKNALFTVYYIRVSCQVNNLLRIRKKALHIYKYFVKM